MDESENVKETDQKVYEVGYLLVPRLSEEEVPGVYSGLKELLAKLGGEVVADDTPKVINLAYTMSKVIQNVRNKFNTAYFGWTKFTMEPEKVLELKKNLGLDTNFLRFLIIKTVKENTMASRRFVSREGSTRPAKPFVAKRTEAEVVVPINKEEIDKEIEALVSTE